METTKCGSALIDETDSPIENFDSNKLLGFNARDEEAKNFFGQL